MTHETTEASSDDVSRETLGDEPRVKEYFGAAYPAVARFAELLRDQGELRGLIGPRELPRIWERHILNSAAVVPYLPAHGSIADVGSGAGLPGIVIAAMLPHARILLVEPMERRCAWLTEVSEELQLANVEVKRGRAEEFHGAFTCDAVTSRAVAPLDKLARMSLPLARKGGEMIVLKGRNVSKEIEAVSKILRKYGASKPEILEGTTVEGVEPTTVVRISRKPPTR